MTYILRREQWIPRPIDEVFAFFADARNLEEITPPWLGFRILAMSTGSIAEGTAIRYRLRLHRHTHSLANRDPPMESSPQLCRRADDRDHTNYGITRTGLKRTAAGPR